MLIYIFPIYLFIHLYFFHSSLNSPLCSFAMFWETNLTLWSSLSIELFILTMIFLISMHSFILSDSYLFCFMDAISSLLRILSSNLNYMPPLCPFAWLLILVLIFGAYGCPFLCVNDAMDRWCGLSLPSRACLWVRVLASGPEHKVRVLAHRLRFGGKWAES